jgi:hypothetical protein
LEFDNELPKFKYSPDHIAKSLSKARLGGICGINICGAGETLLPPEIIPITNGLLKEGHYVNLITNGTISKRFEQLCEFPEDLLSRLFIKFSFQFLELKRLNLFETFVKNVHKIRNAKISFTIEVTPNDELIPYIEEIKQFSIENFGALPHITVARNNKKKSLPILTNLSKEEYKKIWGQFDSIMFDYKMKCFNVKRKEFCYAGAWSAFLLMGTGELKQCYFGKTINPNIYENINKKIDFSNPIGYYCPESHCFNSHAWLAFGDIPEHPAPTYAQIRNRICKDGTEWLQPKIKSFFSSKLCESNEKIAHSKRPSFIKKFLLNIKSNWS